MAHPVNCFINPEPGSQEYSAVDRAVKNKPQVRRIGTVNGERFYLVSSTRDLDVSYVVRLWEDPDREITEDEDGNLYIAERGEFWIQCACAGASPPTESLVGVLVVLLPWTGLMIDVFDEDSGLLGWVPKACYHEAAVLIFGDWNDENF